MSPRPHRQDRIEAMFDEHHVCRNFPGCLCGEDCMAKPGVQPWLLMIIVALTLLLVALSAVWSRMAP